MCLLYMWHCGDEGSMVLPKLVLLKGCSSNYNDNYLFIVTPISK